MVPYCLSSFNMPLKQALLWLWIKAVFLEEGRGKQQQGCKSQAFILLEWLLKFGMERTEHLLVFINHEIVSFRVLVA